MIFQEVHNAGSLDGAIHSQTVVRHYCTGVKLIYICSKSKQCEGVRCIETEALNRLKCVFSQFTHLTP